ncbi:hypothetical protein, partial [Shewanella sp.]|uniref:hypothetical protein n=1 Tax=Shewanella sp. TaxID=50422 RepID=UPI004047AF72
MDRFFEDTEEKFRKLKVFTIAREKAFEKLFKEFWYDKSLKTAEITDDYIPEVCKEEFQKYVGKRGKARYKYLLITINFKPDVDFEMAYKQFEKYTKKKWIDKCINCFEWRKEMTKDDNGGMHIHSKVWIADKKNPYKCKGEVYNTFKNLVGNKLHVNVRYSNAEGCFEDYIAGLKKKK